MKVVIANPERTGSIRVLTHDRGRGDVLGRAVGCFTLKPGEQKEHRTFPGQTVTLQFAA